MKTLVTGGAGFIGSNLVDRLLSDGHTVTVIDNESSDTCHWNPAAKNYKYDVRDYTMVRKLYEGQDVVFHLAATVSIPKTVEDPLFCFENNIIGTATVLECARVCGVKRVVYSSTSAAYGLMNPPPLKESMPRDCLNAYAISKTAGEDICSMYSRLYGMETVCFRYFNVYGNRQPLSGQYAPVIGIFMRQNKNGEPLTVVGDGTQRRDFVNVSDVVEANVKASVFSPQMGYEWGQVYNIGTGRCFSVNEVAAMIGGEIIHIPPRPAEVMLSVSDSSKAKNDLGWSSTVSLEDWVYGSK